MALPPSVEVKFIQERAGAIDPAFSIPVTFDAQRAVASHRHPEHALKAAMQQYQTLKCEPKLDFDVDNCSWSKLFELLGAVQEDYAAKAKGGLKGVLRKLGRDAGEKTETILPIIDAIPDEFGLSIIRAGLAWMFTLAKQYKHARNEIFDLFAEFPSIILEVKAAKENFRNDGELMQLAVSTESEIVNATLELIKFLLPKHQTEKIFPAFSNVPSASFVIEIVGNVRKPAQALKRRSDVLYKEILMETNRNTRTITRETQAIRQNTFMVNGRVEKIEEQLTPIHQTVNNICHEVRRFEKDTFDKFATAIEAQNGLLQFLRGQKDAFEARLASIESGITRVFQISLDFERQRALTSQSMPVVLLSIDRLFLDLNITSPQLVGDLEQVLRQGSRLDPLAMSQAQQLFRIDRFWLWYSRASSDLIMVYASFPNGETLSRMSPLSATSGTLITSISCERPGDIVLYFFCGQHTSPRDPLAGPQGVMRCLLARLLVEVRARSQLDIHLDPNDASTIYEGIRHHNMETMCRVFQLLIVHVPQETSFFCIVDGVSWLDQPSYIADTVQMIQLFRSLVTDSRRQFGFKCMLTGPWYPSSFNSVINPGEHINLVQGALMENLGASSPLFNRHTLSPVYQPRLFQNR